MDDLTRFESPCARLGRRFELRAETGSTNDDARTLAAQGAPHGTLVVADTQSSGRGRRGRHWSSPPGENLYASFVLRPQIALADAPLLALVAGLAFAEALGAFTAVPVRVKWPNDVRAANRKLAGVLVEGSLRGSELAWVVLGVGVNVRGLEAPPGLESIATSLRMLRGGDDLARADVLAALCARLEARLDAFERDGFSGLHRDLTARCETLGARVTVEGVEGVAESIAADGALCIRTDAGALVPVRVGEVG